MAPDIRSLSTSDLNSETGGRFMVVTQPHSAGLTAFTGGVVRQVRMPARDERLTAKWRSFDIIASLHRELSFSLRPL